MARCSNSVVKLEFVIDRRSGSRRRGVLERTRDQHVVVLPNCMKADCRVSPVGRAQKGWTDAPLPEAVA